ncbi:hypothetical protein [Chrysiogenes arsenatis]|uniref:hypothetical protein n=1 Tax=Chrysiogenes arsenatis TaxID=309797 RepID=UPI000418907C|nr:hypothetical protein [Chrysiogenes arsenatis]
MITATSLHQISNSTNAATTNRDDSVKSGAPARGLAKTLANAVRDRAELTSVASAGNEAHRPLSASRVFDLLTGQGGGSQGVFSQYLTEIDQRQITFPPKQAPESVYRAWKDATSQADGDTVAAIEEDLKFDQVMEMFRSHKPSAIIGASKQEDEKKNPYQQEATRAFVEATQRTVERYSAVESYTENDSMITRKTVLESFQLSVQKLGF